uniref:Uncharacterized protein n=1 Tax=viral metagenome TaxID=1070528 RepID=A0A6C0EPB9_9ZZZZ
MVRYYGRARQRTGSVNRNQPGLKMQGCVTGAGRPSWISRYIKNRVNCNARVGCVDANGNLTGKVKVWDANGISSCASNGTASNPRHLLIPQAPRSRGCAGGVYMLRHNVKCR